MGGTDDDWFADLEKWFDAQRVQVARDCNDLFSTMPSGDRVSQIGDDSATSRPGPFERFKHFIDGNVEFLAQLIKDFPANVTELRDRMQAEQEARRQDELNVWRRWTGSEQSPDHIRMQVERASREEVRAVEDATYMLLRESFERNKKVPMRKILDLYRDNDMRFGALDKFATPMLSFGGACYYAPESVANLPSTARWGSPASRQRWLSVDWFKRNPYSPIQLEDHPDMSDAGTKWRAAFEDLLCAALEKPMMSEEKIGERLPYGRPQSTYYGPGLDWMLSLQCRGILPPQLPSLYREYGCSDESFKISTTRLWGDIDDLTAQNTARTSSVAGSALKRLFDADLGRLKDEVATQVQYDDQVFPLTQQRTTPWPVTETEQQLYDEMPPINAAPAPGRQGLSGPVLTGDHDDNLAEAVDALQCAVDDEDVNAAVACLKAYHATHGKIEELLGSNYNESTWDSRFGPPPMWWSIINEALSRAFPGQAVPRSAQPNQAVSSCPSVTNSSSSEGGEKASSGRPDILSQLTTKQETRLPDGTVITKIVLKKRFIDGREETHESVHTANAEVSSLTTTDEPRSDRDEQQMPLGKGWFWK